MVWSCTICFNPLDYSKTIVSLICGHVYHFDCIEKWSKESQTCPECRKSVSISSAVKLFLSVSDSGDHLIKLESELKCAKDELSLKEVALQSSQSQIRILQESRSEIHLTKLRNDLKFANSQVCILQEKIRLSEEQLTKLRNDLKFANEELNVKKVELEDSQSRIEVEVAMNNINKNYLTKLENDLKCVNDELNLKNELLCSQAQVQIEMKIARDNVTKLENELKCIKDELNLKNIQSQVQISEVQNRDHLNKLKNYIKRANKLNCHCQTAINHEKKLQLKNELKILQDKNWQLEKFILYSKFQSFEAKNKFIRSLNKMEDLLKRYPNLPNAKVTLKRLDTSFLKSYFALLHKK